MIHYSHQTKTLVTGELGFHAYSVKFSPLSSSVVAVVASENYGLQGRGELLLYNLMDYNTKALTHGAVWREALFDLAWSEENMDTIVTAAGDGQLQIWNTRYMNYPVNILREHTREASTVEWMKTKEGPLFLSASWDTTIKMWDANYFNSLTTMVGHSNIIYGASWSPKIPSCIASVSGDGTFKLWNTKTGNVPSMSINVSSCELLCVDWNKFNGNLLAIGTTDGHVHIFDLRNPKQASSSFQAHTHAVRKVKYSPHHYNILCTCSYDFSTRIFDTNNLQQPRQTFTAHSEFVYGLDMSALTEGLIIDCSWDKYINVYELYAPPPPPPIALM